MKVSSWSLDELERIWINMYKDTHTVTKSIYVDWLCRYAFKIRPMTKSEKQKHDMIMDGFKKLMTRSK